MCFKEAAVEVILPGNRVMALDEVHDRNPARDELKVLQKRYRNLWSFYVFVDRSLVDRRAELACLCQERFGWPSVYQP